MIQRGGQVVINMMANVKQKTIEPFIKETIVPGTLVYTDEYSIYARLCAWGYDHKRVNHGRGEYARDEDGDGFCEVPKNVLLVRENVSSSRPSRRGDNWCKPSQAVDGLQYDGRSKSAWCEPAWRLPPVATRHV